MSSTQKVKAIKIDVASQSVYEVEVAQQGLQDVYNAIGNNCELVEIAMTFAPSRNQTNGDIMLVDEEILLRPNNIVGGFTIGNIQNPFCNNAIIFGNEDEMISDVTLPIDVLRKDIKFISKDWFTTYEPTISVTSW